MINFVALLRLLALIALIPLILVLATVNALVTAIPRYRHAYWAPKLIYNAFKISQWPWWALSEAHRLMWAMT